MSKILQVGKQVIDIIYLYSISIIYISYLRAKSERSKHIFSNSNKKIDYKQFIHLVFFSMKKVVTVNTSMP